MYDYDALNRTAASKGLFKGLTALGAGLIDMGRASTQAPGDRPGLLNAVQGYEAANQNARNQTFQQPIIQSKLEAMKEAAAQRERMDAARGNYAPGTLGSLSPVAAMTIDAEAAAKNSTLNGEMVPVYVPGKGNTYVSKATANLMGYGPAISIPQGAMPDDAGGMIYDPDYIAGQAEIQAAGTEAAQGGVNLTPAQEKIDAEFAPVYTDWTLKGGRGDTMKGLAQLDGVRKRLEAGEGLTGVMISKQPDSVLAMTNPAALDAKDQVEEVVQRNLRLILGPQFTESEGKRLIERAYNMELSPQMNAKRLGRLIQAMQWAAKAQDKAAQYYEANGTLQGYRGEYPTMSDIESMAFEDSGTDDWEITPVSE